MKVLLRRALGIEDQTNEEEEAIHEAEAGLNRVMSFGEPDARSSDQGYTALHLAANNGNIELIDFLLFSGADRTLKTGSGETPFDLAVKKGHESAADLLK